LLTEHLPYKPLKTVALERDHPLDTPGPDGVGAAADASPLPTSLESFR
jgi:hypothetical protein